MADLLLGLPYNRKADTSSKLTDIIPYYGAYVQDNFRLTNKITVNAGLRWEHEGGVQEQNNGLIVNFNETAASPIASEVPGLNLKGAVEYAGVGGAPTHVGNYNFNKWGPRGGIAWQLDSKTVVRGGYGLFWAPQLYLGGPIGTLGYANNTQYTGKSSTDVLTNPFPMDCCNRWATPWALPPALGRTSPWSIRRPCPPAFNSTPSMCNAKSALELHWRSAMLVRIRRISRWASRTSTSMR